MNTIYVLSSFISFIGAILLIISFYNKFKNLSLLQKISIILIVLGTVVPFIIGFVNGFINH